jgi:cytochrome oxidase assembly protein ShyY1
MYFTWWRMPEEEWTVYHRFKSYFLEGQLDLSKEVLIPRTKVVNGKKEDGYDVLNPVYCYEGGRISMKNQFAGEDPIKVDRAAIIVNRGWIPAAYRDKRSRPEELNTR